MLRRRHCTQCCTHKATPFNGANAPSTVRPIPLSSHITTGDPYPTTHQQHPDETSRRTPHVKPLLLRRRCTQRYTPKTLASTSINASSPVRIYALRIPYRSPAYITTAMPPKPSFGSPSLFPWGAPTTLCVPPHSPLHSSNSNTSDQTGVQGHHQVEQQ